MASLAELENALRKADAAGDMDAAKQLAGAYRHQKIQEQVASDPISQGAKNFARDMPWYQKVAAGYGKALPDTVSGVRQLFDSGAPTLSGLVTGDKRSKLQQEIDEQKRLDEPLMHTLSGFLGNVGGESALYAPTAAIPGGGSLLGSGLIGGASGAIQPTKTGESRALNAAGGAVAGFGGQTMGRLLGRLIRPVVPSLTGEEARLAQVAAKEGIPLSAGQQTGSLPLKTIESVLEKLPFTSKSQLAGREAQQRAFTAAALKKGGMTGESADAATLLAQKRNLGTQMGDIAENSKLDFNQGLTDQLAKIVGNADSHLPPDMSGRVTNVTDKILSQVDQSGNMLGTNYQGWREPLRGMAQEGGAQGNSMGQIRRSMDEAFGTQAGTQYKDLSRKYANTKTIIDAMGGAGRLPATGQVAPAQLGAALARSIGREGKALGKGDLNDLSKVGQLFVKDVVPDSGTAQRQFYTNMLGGGMGAGTGAIAGYASGHDPLEGAVMGGALGAGGALTPRLMQMLLNSKAGQAYLKSGILPIEKADRAALANILRTGTIGTTLSLENQ